MFKTIKNALKTPEVRKRLLYTLVLIIVFRIGCFITVPGVDMLQLETVRESNASGIAGLIDIISGGAFSNFSIFAMSVTPYITASIVIQLLTLIVPSLKRLTQEGGEVGRQRINKYTKIISIILALIEGIGLYLSYQSQGIFVNSGALSAVLVVTGLMAGTALLMWLGEQITDKGIGNGVSMIIFIGIVSRLPSAINSIWGLIMTESGFISVRLTHPDEMTCIKYKLDITAEKQKSYMQLTISASDSGIAEDDMKYLCEPYAQLEKGKKNFLRALKLGTASILTKRANGLISIKSEIMKGTKYCIVLPIEKE